jgi:hypothetical protein
MPLENKKVGRSERKSRMSEKQKQGAKQAARELYRDRRISLEMAIWAMKNAGYARAETAEWLELTTSPMEMEIERN